MKLTKQIFLLIFIALILNLIWEFAHASLYFDLSGIPLTPHLILASLTDMIIVFKMFALISLKNRNLSWIKKPNKTDYSLIIILGLAIASFLEIININLGRWAYKEVMPTVLGIGLSPLLQLFTTAILSLWIFRKTYLYFYPEKK